MIFHEKIRTYEARRDGYRRTILQRHALAVIFGESMRSSCVTTVRSGCTYMYLLHGELHIYFRVLHPVDRGLICSWLLTCPSTYGAEVSRVRQYLVGLDAWRIPEQQIDALSWPQRSSSPCALGTFRHISTYVLRKSPACSVPNILKLRSPGQRFSA